MFLDLQAKIGTGLVIANNRIIQGTCTPRASARAPPPRSVYLHVILTRTVVNSLRDGMDCTTCVRIETLVDTCIAAASNSGVSGTMMEDWSASAGSIKALQSVAAQGILVQVHHYGSCQNQAVFETQLAGFLIGAGRLAYFGCSNNWAVQVRMSTVCPRLLHTRVHSTRGCLLCCWPTALFYLCFPPITQQCCPNSAFVRQRRQCSVLPFYAQFARGL